MLWGNFIKGKAIQLSIVALIMTGLICAMGFFASPVINQWLEPRDLEKLIGSDSSSQVKALTGTPVEQNLAESSSLVLHFIKGFASLGVLGFLRAIMWLSPFPWFNLRADALAGGRQRRVRNSTTFQLYLVLVAGWFAILQPTYVFVRDRTQERLEMLSDKIIDVQGYDNPYEGSYD
ncbi:hypothetical protein HYALB_00009496 [Hymenoscyphus albidus]|uniref:Uncharacterized protein n=1 Tax=Hymenoscyphus albidus TaxID=595503 RepID=A0A9N9PV56_9HELO|nr:hypothetical protein HYALB_00009496 [Hymenoscyphus albidus]